MEGIINHLQEIQSDLIGIIIPILVTAIVSIITTIISSISKIILNVKKINNEQYIIMQKIYPELRMNFIDIDIKLANLKKNNLHTNILSSINKYDQYRKNEQKYRKNHENEILDIDNFKKLMDDYILSLTKLSTYLSKTTLPNSPVYHPILKNKINKMMNFYYYYSLLLSRYFKNEINGELLKTNLDNIIKFFCKKFNNDAFFENLIILDQWITKY